MSAGGVCHYCHKINCICPDRPSAKTGGEMSDHKELREAARQSIDGCNEKLKALLADFDRVKAERDNYQISLRELAKSMTAKISVLEHQWYPKEDELIRWREFGEVVADYCRRMNFEVMGETRGDQIFSTVTNLLEESSQ